MFAKSQHKKSPDSEIVGREDKAKEIIKYLLGYEHGMSVPFVSIYGRSGSGKSSVVRFVCETLDEVQYCMADLRKAKTVFGCANAILSELGLPALKNASGINSAFGQIRKGIISRIKESKTPMFALVLDEFDVLFADSRGSASDFVYNLVQMCQELRDMGMHMCIIAVSNGVTSDHLLDDRVRSRIGRAEVSFDSYSESELLEILRYRAKGMFSKMPGRKALEYCAKLSSGEHGDARRAVDLLRVGSEIASSKSVPLDVAHIDAAHEQLQQDTIVRIVGSSSYHQKVAVAALARMAYMTDEAWHPTSALYNQYKKMLGNDEKPLSYRRVSELLSEMTSLGIAVSQTGSKGRHGYGTQYKLLGDPDIVGYVCFPEWWKTVKSEKAREMRNNMLAKIRKGPFGRGKPYMKIFDDIMGNM